MNKIVQLLISNLLIVIGKWVNKIFSSIQRKMKQSIDNRILIKAQEELKNKDKLVRLKGLKKVEKVITDK